MSTTHTDLLDRYLHAVKFWLPKAQQQDIIAEIAEDLRSQVEDREASLGHPLSEDDLAGILKQRGSPLRVASGYLPEQHLISPAVVPIYRLVLWIVLLWVLAPLFVVVFIGPFFSSGHPARVLLRFCGEAWRAGFMTVGIVTVVFALLDRYYARVQGIDRWDPRKLPRIPAAQPASLRWNDLTGFILGAFAAACLASLMWRRGEIVFPGQVRVIFGPFWQHLYWPALALTVARASLDLFSFLDPGRTRLRSGARIAMDAFTLILVAAVSQTHNWVKIAAPNLPLTDLAKAMPRVNGSVDIALLAVAVIALADAIREIRRLLRAGQAKPTAILTVS